jgi:hypothetical protein
MAEVNRDMQEGFLRVNSLLYEFPPQLSVSSRRHRVTNYFQRNTYSPSETMVLDSQTGSTFVYGPDSYLTFGVQSVGAAANFGSGSCLNLINTVRVKTRGGQELNRIENFNVLASKHAKWTNEDSWLNSEASAMGFAGGAVENKLHNLLTGSRTQYTIPLKFIAPIFAQSKLLPPQLCEGLRIEIELEKSSTALVGAGVTGYTLLQPQVLFDATTIADAFTRRIAELSATQGLNIMYSNFYSNQVSGSAGQSSFNYDVKKAASKCMRLWVVSRDVAKINAAASDSIGSLPFDYSSISTHIGADYVPNVPIRVSGYVATTIDGGANSENVRLTSEAYFHVLSAVRDQEKPKYPAVRLEHINYNADKVRDAVLVFSYNKSTFDNISGYDVNNSRALIVDLEISTVVNDPGVSRRLDNWMEHLRNVNIFPNQAVISD